MPSRTYRFEELVDVAVLQRLTDDLHVATGIPSAIIGPDGTILTGSGWQRICTEFHRRHPEVERECIASDLAIRERLEEGEDFVVYECPRGLVDASAPILIEGEHVASVFVGQLFLTPPDDGVERRFREAAGRFGFDEAAYVAAFRAIPVLPRERLLPILRFLAQFARLVADIGLARKRELEEMERRVEAERTSARRMESLLQTTMDGFWQLDMEGRILDVNDTACRMLGYTRDELLRMRIPEIDALETPAETARHIEHLRAVGQDRFETRHRRKDGVVIDVEVSTQSLPWDHGRMVAFIRDVTAAKEAEARLRQSQKLEAIGTLAGGIAHDFNNILGAIVGFTELTLDAVPAESEARENLEEVLVASQRARDLVRQILDFSRAGETRRRPVEPARIVAEAMKLLRSTLPRTITIDVAVDGGAGYVLADPTQLHQVVMNLCANAYHAMCASRGTLAVRVARKAVTAAEAGRIEGLEPGSFVTIVVRDTGEGMPPETLARIFDPYFTTKPRGQGTGLGLAVVHGIVHALGGAIGVESALGEGSAFTVYLPLHDERRRSDGEPAPTVVERGHERVLFVDDEPALARLGRRMLQRLGYEVTSADDPVLALRRFEEDPDAFDLIVTDQTMPRITGSELIRRARELKPDLPTVIFTGYSDVIDEANAKALGVTEFAMKPYDLAKLGRVVRDALASG